MPVTSNLSALRDTLTLRLLGRHVATIKKAASVILNEVKNLSSFTTSDCVKTPFMVRLGSPRTEERHRETKYLAVRPEPFDSAQDMLCRRAPVKFSHSLASGTSFRLGSENDTSPQSFLILILPFLILMGGCASQQKVAPAIPAGGQAEAPGSPEAKPEPEVAQGKKAPPVTVEELQLPKFERAAPPKILPPSQPIDPKRLVPTEEPLMINVDNMPLPDFIIQGIGGTLKVSVYIDEQVKNMKDTITLRMGRPLPAPDVLALALGVLEKKNLVVEEKAGTLYVLQSKTRIAGAP